MGKATVISKVEEKSDYDFAQSQVGDWFRSKTTKELCVLSNTRDLEYDLIFTNGKRYIGGGQTSIYDVFSYLEKHFTPVTVEIKYTID